MLKEAKVRRNCITNRESQLQEAVAWCKENGCRGYLALKSGLFPLIKQGGHGITARHHAGVTVNG